MTLTEVTTKLIGPTTPLGDSSQDGDRLENMKAMCELTQNLVYKLQAIADACEDSHEHSVKQAGQYARNFLLNLIQ